MEKLTKYPTINIPVGYNGGIIWDKKYDAFVLTEQELFSLINSATLLGYRGSKMTPEEFKRLLQYWSQ